MLDFYGPADLLTMAASKPDVLNNPKSPEALLLGAMAFERPDLAKAASPVSYVDKNDPPFFIVQGEKDESVPYTQSVLLSSFLKQAGVKHELTIVKDAPHYGPMFDVDSVREKLFLFLKSQLNP